MFGFIIGILFKRIASTLISVIIIISSVLGGNFGEYARLYVKPLTFENNILSEISVKLTLSSQAIYLLTGVNTDTGKTYRENLSLCVDKDELRVALLDTLGQELVVLDTNGLSTDEKFIIMALDIIGQDYLTAYNKYFSGKGFYSDFEELFPYEVFSYEQLNYIKEAREHPYGIDFVLQLLERNEGISHLIKIFKYNAQALEMCYDKSGINGKDSCSFKMYLSEYFEYLKKCREYTQSQEYNSNVESFSRYLASELSKEYSGITEAKREDIIDEIVQIFSYFGKNEKVKYAINAVISGDAEALGEYAVLMPYIKNSYVEAEIYEESSEIFESISFVIGDGNTELIVLEILINSKNTDKKIVESPDFVKSTDRITFEQIDCKRAYDKAKLEKVSDVNIFWVSTMTQNYSVPHISDTNFTVNYLSGNTDNTDCVAYLLDGSIFLPLRKTLEYAGYDVGWDDKSRKAYVMVDTMTIDMTGVLIDGKTYVKVRDFEKLGAVVSYSESFIYNNAYNDFGKNCTAKISFQEQ